MFSNEKGAPWSAKPRPGSEFCSALGVPWRTETATWRTKTATWRTKAAYIAKTKQFCAPKLRSSKFCVRRDPVRKFYACGPKFRKFKKNALSNSQIARGSHNST